MYLSIGHYWSIFVKIIVSQNIMVSRYIANIWNTVSCYLNVTKHDNHITHYLFHSKYTLLHIKLVHKFSAIKISLFTVSGLSLDLPCTASPLYWELFHLVCSLHILISTLVQILTDLGKFSDVVTTIVKVKTQHLIVDKGGNFLILFLLNLSMIQVQQETEFLQLVVFTKYSSPHSLVHLLRWHVTRAGFP